MRIKGLLATVFVGVALMGAGCGGPDKPVGPKDGLTPGEAVAEYQAESKTLALAPGWKWPADPAFDPTGPDGKPMYYQRGYGKAQAGFYWYCSWSRVYLAAQGQARDDAWTQVVKVRDTYYYKVAMLPPDQAEFESGLTKAGLGDLTQFTEVITLNCPEATR
jgi:hypothetical protein